MIRRHQNHYPERFHERDGDNSGKSHRLQMIAVIDFVMNAPHLDHFRGKDPGKSSKTGLLRLQNSVFK